MENFVWSKDRCGCFFVNEIESDAVTILRGFSQLCENIWLTTGLKMKFLDNDNGTKSG